MTQQMINEDYPDTILGKDIGKYKTYKTFDGSATYKEDYEQAVEYAKKINGVLYTMVDGWGTTIDYYKGLHYFDRLGFVVIKLEEVDDNENEK